MRILYRYGLDTSGSDSAADTAINTGETAISSFDPTTTTGSQKEGLGESGLGGLLSGETNDYISKYTKALNDLYNTGYSKYNVSNLANTATSLSNRLTNVTPNAYTASKGYDIDATDINNGIANSTAYLTPQSNAATNNYNTASTLAQNYVTTNAEPYKQEGTLLAQEEAAQSTGWNQTNQEELDGLIAKMNAGETLSTTEMSRANTLATAEASYQSAVATATATITAAEQQTENYTLNPTQKLYNTTTGKTYTA